MKLLLCRCSTGAFPDSEAHADEPRARQGRPLFVVGILGTRPKTRAFVTERAWADQTKPAFSDAVALARRNLGRNHAIGVIDLPQQFD